MFNFCENLKILSAPYGLKNMVLGINCQCTTSLKNSSNDFKDQIYQSPHVLLIISVWTSHMDIN